MTIKLEQAARQALEALESKLGETHPFAYDLEKAAAIRTLREALSEPKRYNHETGSVLIPNPLAEQAEQEPSCNQHPDAPHGFDRNASHNAGRYVCECESWEPEQAEQEPVAYVLWGDNNVPSLQWDKPTGANDVFNELYYTAPVRTKDLTDDEIVDVMNKIYGSMWTEQDRDFARAVIAADREKNK